MKTKLKMISGLLVLLLVFSLTGAAASADPVPVPGDAVLNVSVTVDRDEYVPGSYIDGEGNEIPLDPDKVLSDGEQIPVCSVSYVSRDNQEIGYEDSLINLLDRDRQIGIRLTPLDGFYIYDIALVGGDYAPSSKSLLSAAKAKLGTTTVTLFLSDVAGPEGGSITINGDYVSSWGVGSDCTLNVSCRRINENVQTYVSYDSGEHYAETPWGEAGNGAWICYAADMPQTLVTDESGTWQFTGYKLVYDTGAYQDIDAQDEILVYTNATLVAQWENVSEQYQGGGTEGGDDDYTDYTVNTDDFNYSEGGDLGLDTVMTASAPLTPPAAIVQAPGAQKEFDGYPLEMAKGSDVTVITDENGNNFKVVIDYAGNSITGIGSVENAVTSYAIYDMNDTLLFDREDLDAFGGFRALNGSLTVTEPSYKQYLTVRGVSATVDAVSEDQMFYAADLGAEQGYTDGYAAEGLLPGHWISGTDIVTGSGSTDFDTVVNAEAVHIYMNNGIENVDVTALYDVHAENGHVTVNAFVPAPTPVIPAVTVEAPSASKPFDGTPLTMDPGTDVTVVNDEQGLTYRIVLSYAGGSRTEIGSIDNEVTSCVINDGNDVPLFSWEELQAAPQFRVQNGTLTVADPAEKQTLVVTGITANVTVKAADQTVTLADCSAEGFSGGYRVTGLFDGHRVVGENIVSGQGTAPGFDTVVNAEAISVYSGDTDVTALYNITPVNGYVTVTVETPEPSTEPSTEPTTSPEPSTEPTTPPEPEKPTVPNLTLRGLDASKEYDGTPLTMQGDKGYLLSGTIGEYKIVVTYNSITEIGSLPAISSYELRDAQGKTVFTKAELDASDNFTVETLGTLTITKPEPTIPKARLTVQPLTKE